MIGATASFSSGLAAVFARYVDLKRALGSEFRNGTRTLQSLDRFLCAQTTNCPDLNGSVFQAWCKTQENLVSGVRRTRMREVYNFCLYRRRAEPHCFVPDPAWFPKPHQRLQPYIFSEQEVVRLLGAASRLRRFPSSPLRPNVTRLVIVLLFATGIRLGELLRLTLGDYDHRNATLLIRESKFHKSRLLPLNGDIAGELDHYLRSRSRLKLPISVNSALISSGTEDRRAYSPRTVQRTLQSLFQQCSILTKKGRPPRIHDARHSFAVNALLRWYREGADVGAKLPLLATYMGHVSVASTHYYVQWIEPLRTAASERFARHYGELVVPLPRGKGGQR